MTSRRIAVRAGCAVAALGALSVLMPGIARSRVPPPFSDGRLFRTDRAGMRASFVFGTIHVADPRVSAIPGEAGQALERSRTLAMEIAPGFAREDALAELEQLADGARIESLIGARGYRELRARLALRGVPEAVVARLKPWAALVRLEPVEPDRLSLDENLFAVAQARRMRLVSLESIDEQAAAFDAIPVESQVALLQHALFEREAVTAAREPTIRAWLRGDLSAIARLAAGEGFPPAIAAHYAVAAKHLIDDRSALLHHRLFFPLRAGGTLVAIGAAHLPGERGLLRMLVRDGYRITRVW